MKTSKIFSALAAGAILVGLWSCSDEKTYSPTPEEKGDAVYFSDAEPTEVEITNGASQVSVQLFRSKATDELTVQLETTITEANGDPTTNIFDPTTQVTFPVGVTSIPVPIEVTFADVTPEEKYKMKMKILGEHTSKYGLSEQTFTIIYSPWTDYKPFKGSEPALVTMSGPLDFDEKPIPVYESKSLVLDRKKFQFGDYECPELQDENKWQSLCNGNNGTIFVDTLEYIDEDKAVNAIRFEPMSLNIDYNNEDIQYTDVYTYVTEINPGAIPEGASPEDFKSMSGYIIDQGLFVVNAIYYTASGIVMQQDDYYQLPGFPDYALTVNYDGIVIPTDTNEEEIEISIHRTEDVFSYAYKLCDGKLTQAQATKEAESLINNEDYPLYYDETSKFRFILHDSGYYTVVAVGYNKDGKYACRTAYAFEYKRIVPYTWRSIGLCEYTDGFIYPYYSSMEPETWDTEVEQSTVNPGLIRLVNPYRYRNGGWPYADPNYDLKGNYYIEINFEDKEMVYVNQAPLGIMMSERNGEMYVWSRADEALKGGTRPATIKRWGYFGEMDADQCITFPGASLLIAWGGMRDDAGNLDWSYTNLTPDFKLKDATPADYDAELKKTGPFYLSLKGKDLSPKAPRNVVRRNGETREVKLHQSYKAERKNIYNAVPTDKVKRR